ncbi:MAG: hypothetical protein WC050_00285 [Candidatus Paceibacterota bacterium]
MLYVVAGVAAVLAVVGAGAGIVSAITGQEVPFVRSCTLHHEDPLRLDCGDMRIIVSIGVFPRGTTMRSLKNISDVSCAGVARVYGIGARKIVPGTLSCKQQTNENVQKPGSPPGFFFITTSTLPANLLRLLRS